jgi:hypothetical protein
MYDIKYFFLNKNNQTFQRGNFRGGKLPKISSKNTIFSKYKGGTCPSWTPLDLPLHLCLSLAREGLDRKPIFSSTLPIGALLFLTGFVFVKPSTEEDIRFWSDLH